MPILSDIWYLFEKPEALSAATVIELMWMLEIWTRLELEHSNDNKFCLVVNHINGLRAALELISHIIAQNILAFDLRNFDRKKCNCPSRYSCSDLADLVFWEVHTFYIFNHAYCTKCGIKQSDIIKMVLNSMRGLNKILASIIRKQFVINVIQSKL